MPELSGHRRTLAYFAGLSTTEYSDQVKRRLRSDEGFLILLDPVLVERTRATLSRMVESIDKQRERVEREGAEDPTWFKRIDSLRAFVKVRLDSLPPVNPETARPSHNRETRAWRAFAADLARVLADADPEALEALRTPYNDMSAAEWLAARNEKQETGR